jgi:hypothetical protein
MAQLYIYPKTGEPSAFPLGARRVTIGRASTNDIVLSDQYSSGVHAVLAPPKGYVLIDQGSRTGPSSAGAASRQMTTRATRYHRLDPLLLRPGRGSPRQSKDDLHHSSTRSSRSGHPPEAVRRPAPKTLRDST